MPSMDEQQFTNLIRALNEVMARQDRLEERLNRLEGTPASAKVIAPLPPSEPEPVPLFTAPVPEEPQLESKVGLTWLNRIGVITLVLGVGFFFKWAVDNNWIGPSGRVMLGLLAGFLTLGFADYLWRKGQQVYAQGITGAGVAIVYLSFYAAFDFYHLVPQALAFVLLLATTAMAATLAMRYNALAIAVLGFFGAYLIPLLLSNGEDHPWFLMGYLLVLNVAATELAGRRAWKVLEVLSFVATVLIFGSWLLSHGRHPVDKAPATVGVLLFCAQRFRTSLAVLFLIGEALVMLSLAFVWEGDESVFYALVLMLVTTIGALAFSHERKYPGIVISAFAGFWLAVGIDANHAATFMPIGSAGYLLFVAWAWWRFAMLEETPQTPGLAVFALNGVVYYSLAYYVLHQHYHHWLGLLAVAVAASYLAFGMALYRKKSTLDVDIVMLALGVSVAFLTLAIPIQLSGFSVTIAWAIQAAALTWIGVRLKKSGALMGALFIFALAFLRLAGTDSTISADTLIFNTRFFVFAVVATAFLLSAYWVSKFEPQLAIVHFVAGHLVLLGGLCLEVIGWAGRNAQPENRASEETVGITILFAVYAVALVSIGVARRSGVHRLAGLVLTGIVILKLYLYDVWQLGRVYQIIAFVILGILLLSTSFLYSRFKGLIEEWKKDETAGF
jgi:uncharacterized membrane protein